ncbi:MAG: hypothetical protein ABIO82_06390 [Ginsengibacter sp.]
MSKQFITTTLLIFFSSVYFTAAGQGKNYGILALDKDSIQSFYNSGIDYLVFTYHHPLFASRKLECTPFTADGVAMKSFKPRKVDRHDKQNLVNKYFDGILVLKIKDLKDSGADGTFDLYFIPIECDQCKSSGFVSYLIDDSPTKFLRSQKKKYIGFIKTEESHQSGPGVSLGFQASFRPLAFKSIRMNPSPPYVGN